MQTFFFQVIESLGCVMSLYRLKYKFSLVHASWLQKKNNYFLSFSSGAYVSFFLDLLIKVNIGFKAKQNFPTVLNYVSL